MNQQGTLTMLLIVPLTAAVLGWVSLLSDTPARRRRSLPWLGAIVLLSLMPAGGYLVAGRIGELVAGALFVLCAFLLIVGSGWRWRRRVD
ncbi:MAG: hypothetical protein ACM3XM_11565 [Mycobacterium leprae]